VCSSSDLNRLGEHVLKSVGRPDVMLSRETIGIETLTSLCCRVKQPRKIGSLDTISLKVFPLPQPSRSEQTDKSFLRRQNY
jgi:hypothetical protein